MSLAGHPEGTDRSHLVRVFNVVSTLAASTLIVSLVQSTSSPAAAPHPGQVVFRHDTFGSEQLWTDTLRMHEVFANVTPKAALSLGLKVDTDALPPPILQALQSGQLNLDDVNVTRRLIELDAVVGVSGKTSGSQIRSIGITCALCHSTVDDRVGPGVGSRLDGWTNLDLDVGGIVSLSPAIGPGLKAEFLQWGPGKYDPRHHAFNGQAIVGLNSPSIPVVIPPVYGLQGVPFETFTGDGPISYWNSYVGVTQMGGSGDFVDPRINLNIQQNPDRVTPKLGVLLAYQLSLSAPPPPSGSFDAAQAQLGQAVFEGPARCGSCHIPTTRYTDVQNGPNPSTPLLHAADTVGADPEYAKRSATFAVTKVPAYRTTPLRALWQHAPYFHDGSAETLADVVDHYIGVLKLTLSPDQRTQLIEFLKSL
jgi:hypothetical protein